MWAKDAHELAKEPDFQDVAQEEITEIPELASSLELLLLLMEPSAASNTNVEILGVEPAVGNQAKSKLPDEHQTAAILIEHRHQI